MKKKEEVYSFPQQKDGAVVETDIRMIPLEEAKLREIKVDLLHENIVYVGGGACVMKRFGRTQGRNIQYVTDVKANAIGYRYLADNLG